MIHIQCESVQMICKEYNGAFAQHVHQRSIALSANRRGLMLSYFCSKTVDWSVIAFFLHSFTSDCRR